MNAAVNEVVEPIRLDIGCGPNPKQGFTGVDILPFDGKVGVVMDAGTDTWPWADDSVEEVHAAHFVEHLNAKQRIHFVNELYRVLKPDAKATVITPHWASNRAYGDLTHQWPPVAEMWFYYLSAEWRAGNAPHTDAKHWADGYKCNFEAGWGYSFHPGIAPRNAEFQQHAMSFFKEAAQDMHATLTKRVPK